MAKTDSSDLNGRLNRSPVQEANQVQPNSLYIINRQLDQLGLPYGVNENTIRRKLAETDCFRQEHSPVYWLTMIRIAETAMIIVGAYTDGCEFCAAGDLLVNPSKILIHIKERWQPVIKKRHGKLSEQFKTNAEPHTSFIHWFKKNAVVEIAGQALLPDLYERLNNSAMIMPWYLTDFKERMNKIADVIGFLSAWNINDVGELFAKMQIAPAEMRKFVNANLCNFSDSLFKQIGRNIRKLENGLGYEGDLLKTAAT